MQMVIVFTSLLLEGIGMVESGCLFQHNKNL
jgi:hypothetical protein